MQAMGLPAPVLDLYLFQYVIFSFKIFFFLNSAMLCSEKPAMSLFTEIRIVLLK